MSRDFDHDGSNLVGSVARSFDFISIPETHLSHAQSKETKHKGPNKSILHDIAARDGIVKVEDANVILLDVPRVLAVVEVHRTSIDWKKRGNYFFTILICVHLFIDPKTLR